MLMYITRTARDLLRKLLLDYLWLIARGVGGDASGFPHTYRYEMARISEKK